MEINLSQNRAKAFVAYHELTSNNESPKLMKDLFIRFKKQELNDIDESTRENKLRSLRNLTLVFGHMRPEDIRRKNVYHYMDERSNK